MQIRKWKHFQLMQRLWARILPPLLERELSTKLSLSLEKSQRAQRGGTFSLCCSLLTFPVLASSYPLKRSLVPGGLGNLGAACSADVAICAHTCLELRFAFLTACCPGHWWCKCLSLLPIACLFESLIFVTEFTGDSAVQTKLFIILDFSLSHTSF